MKVLLSAERIQERVAELAREISRDYGKQPVTIVGVLTGCLMFLADLVRHLDLPLRIDFVQASSYRGPTFKPGQLIVSPSLALDMRERHVLLLDDILDTGQTLHYLTSYMKTLELASLRTAVLLRKEGRQQIALEPHYCGFTIPDAFVVGYGLDYNDAYRNLPYLAVLDE
ncbi:MAG TPA: hypoxanthine phosphoribosyltransferase [Gemmataceae bacterium]|nr:hypoxanthine phosphoribosyltransferase [Gemmataceae bacterium]